MTNEAAVSFIVPAYNAQPSLRDALAAIRRAMRVGDELIVFDDGSTDESALIARQAGARVLRNGGLPRGPAHGRNAAAQMASNPVLLFVDADVVLAPDARDKLLDVMEESCAVATFGSYDDRPRSRRASSLYVNLRHHFIHQHGASEADTFWAGIGMVRRDAFLAVGGFDEAQFPAPSIEDVELGMRLTAAGGVIRSVKAAQGTHCKDWSLWRVWHTDVVRRAIPWSRLIADGRRLGTDLNLSSRERWNAVMALLMPSLLLCCLLNGWFLIAVAAAVTAYLVGNRGFYRFLAARTTPLQLAAAIALHWCYHVYASVTFAMVQASTLLGVRRSNGNAGTGSLR